MLRLVVERHRVPVRVGRVEQAKQVVDVFHGDGERAGAKVADASDVQDAEQNADLQKSLLGHIRSGSYGTDDLLQEKT